MKLRKNFQLEKCVFPLLFGVQSQKKYIAGDSKHSKTYIFLNAETLKYIFKAFSWTLQ